MKILKPRYDVYDQHWGLCQALMDSGEGQLKYLSQLRSFSVWVNATDVGGCRGLGHEDQWESEFFVSRDADSKQTLNWSLKKAQSTPCCQLTNFMTDWAADGWGVITQGISNSQSPHVQVGHDWELKYCTATTQARYFVVINGVKLQLFGFLLGWLKTEI